VVEKRGRGRRNRPLDLPNNSKNELHRMIHGCKYTDDQENSKDKMGKREPTNNKEEIWMFDTERQGEASSVLFPYSILSVDE
jgi:hypothetical protein